MTNQALTVVENLLADNDAETLLSWVETLPYRSVHHQSWQNVWRLLEGSPLSGPCWSMGGNTSEETPKPLVPLTTKLQHILLRGRPGYRLTLSPWLYPVGTALGLHQDAGNLDGAFVYYLTREWDVHWGGLLSCIDEPSTAPRPRRAILDSAAERKSVALSGQGQWISPAWNRLVIIAPQARHFISRVDITAGDRIRITIAGFIHRPSETPI